MTATDLTARWLRDQFAGVSDVRGATTEPDNTVIYQAHEADLVVSTWMGARLYVYILRGAPKIRDLKATLRENSRGGIGTLFITHRDLLPAVEESVKVPDWQEALAALNDGWIYAYGVQDNQLGLMQVHYTSLGVKGTYRIWQLDDFSIDNVTVRKRDVSEGLRGTWHIADIASTAYKRRVNSERANQRFHYRTKYTREVPHGAPNQNHAGNKQQQHTATDKKQLDAYYRMLGVPDNADEKAIKAAFRQMALKVHPDVSALPRAEANQRIKQLNEAYDFIKQYHGWH